MKDDLTFDWGFHSLKNTSRSISLISNQFLWIQVQNSSVCFTSENVTDPLYLRTPQITFAGSWLIIPLHLFSHGKEWGREGRWEREKEGRKQKGGGENEGKKKERRVGKPSSAFYHLHWPQGRRRLRPLRVLLQCPKGSACRAEPWPPLVTTCVPTSGCHHSPHCALLTHISPKSQYALAFLTELF